MRICTECFNKFKEAEIKSWQRNRIQYKEDPFQCPECYDLLHQGWSIPEDILHDPLPEVTE